MLGNILAFIVFVLIVGYFVGTINGVNNYRKTLQNTYEEQRKYFED